MSIAKDIRCAVEKLLNFYRQMNGLGVDPYHDKKIIHPMAEGKYLMALASLKRAELISSNNYDRWLGDSIRRLESSVLQLESGCLGFGLNFPYKNAAADEPYLITTSIVVNGLIESYELAQDKNVVDKLLYGCLVWMTKGLERITVQSSPKLSVPIFSPHNKRVIFNAVAYWARVVQRAGEIGLISPDMQSTRLAKWMLKKHIPGLAWKYDAQSTRIDLVHQCYILNSLLELLPEKIRIVEKKAIQTISHFTVPYGLIDKFDIKPVEEAIQVIISSGSVFCHINSDRAIVFHSETARLWSQGELMSTLATLFTKGDYRDYWMKLLKRNSVLVIGILADESLEAKEKNLWFRHTMHLAHGLSRALEVLRK